MVYNMKDRVVMKVERATRERLKTFGQKGETYNTILNRLMDREEERRE